MYFLIFAIIVFLAIATPQLLLLLILPIDGAGWTETSGAAAFTQGTGRA